MTLYRPGTWRYAKYEKKFNPTVVGTRFTDVKELALERAREGLIKYSAVQELARQVLDKYGVTGPDRAKYLAFVNKLLKHVSRAGGQAAVKIAQGLKQYFVTSYDANPDLLDELINVVAGAVLPY